MTRDGRRFLMAKREERKPRPANELLLVHNGFEDLEGPCPAKKSIKFFGTRKKGEYYPPGKERKKHGS